VCHRNALTQANIRGGIVHINLWIAVLGMVATAGSAIADSYVNTPALMNVEDLRYYKIDETCNTYRGQYQFLDGMLRTLGKESTRVSTRLFGNYSADRETAGAIASGEYKGLVYDGLKRLRMACGEPNQQGDFDREQIQLQLRCKQVSYDQCRALVDDLNARHEEFIQAHKADWEESKRLEMRYPNYDPEEAKRCSQWFMMNSESCKGVVR
jgi:hypothetical protein